MVEYIYFVKCPDCDDEPFSFFDDAKACAMDCLSKKPIITQVEVNRNDFGECTDSADLGTIWSWEDMMSDIPDDADELTVFSKADTLGYDAASDTEFANLDNDLDFLDRVPDNFRKPITENNSVLKATRDPKDSDYVIVLKHPNSRKYTFLGINYKMTSDLNKAMTYSGKYSAENDIKYVEDEIVGSAWSTEDTYYADRIFVTTFAEAKKLLNDSEEAARQRAIRTAEFGARNQEVIRLAREMYDRGDYCRSYEEFVEYITTNTDITPTKDLYYTYYRQALVKYARECGGITAQRAIIRELRKPVSASMISEELVAESEEPLATNKKGDYLVKSSSGGNGYTVFNASNVCLGGFDSEDDEKAINRFKCGDFTESCVRKPIPEGMTIEELVEEMEENEDTVECTWCNELFDKSECRYEVDLGWLCSRCEAAIKSRGETLTFKENNYWDFLDESRDPFDHHDPDYDEEEATDALADEIDRVWDSRYDRSLEEDILDTPIEDVEDYIEQTKKQFPGTDAYFDGNKNQVIVILKDDPTIEEIDEYIKQTKSHFVGAEAHYDGDKNQVVVTLDNKKS